MTTPTVAWLRELAEKLKHSELQYIGLRALAQGLLDPREVANAELQDADYQANAMLQAGLHLMLVVEALRELEPFAGNDGLSPLHDLATAIMELDRGQHSPFLQPRSSVSSGGDSVARNYIKAHAVLGVRLLKEIGIGQMAACKLVAKIFGDAGVRGRKRSEEGVMLSPTTIDDWTAKLDSNGARLVSMMFEDMLNKPGWPWSQEQVTELIKQMAASPLIQTKIRYPPHPTGQYFSHP